MIDLKGFSKFRYAAVLGVVALGTLTGCKSKEQQAIDDAKAKAAASGQAQQVQYIDANGDTSTTVVQPPVQGQAQAVTTSLKSPAPGPKPAKTDPVITPLGAAALPAASPVAQAAAIDSAAAAGSPAATVDTPYTAPPAETLSANAPAMNVKIPAGTSLAIRINQHISVKHNHAGDRFSGEVVEPVSVDGAVIVPKGTHVGGRVDEAHKRGHFKGASILELRLTSMELNGNRYALDTHDNVRTKKGKGKRSTGFIAGMTGAGMVIGGIATGGVGLAIGGAAGCGCGNAAGGRYGQPRHRDSGGIGGAVPAGGLVIRAEPVAQYTQVVKGGRGRLLWRPPLLAYADRGSDYRFTVRRILLASPDSSRCMAWSKSASGRRCVMTGERSIPESRSRASIWNQVSYILRPLIPWTVAPLKMTALARSSSTGREGMPSSEARPPLRRMRKPCAMAEGWPDISRSTSTPLPSVRAWTRSSTESPAGLSSVSAPILRASSRRVSLGSMAMTWAAPQAFATAMEKSPMGAAAGDGDRLAGDGTREHGVDGVAEGVVEGAEVAGDGGV